MNSAPIYPGAVEPARRWWLESFGLRLHLVEWGDLQAPPVLLCHGMWDHVRSFAVLAPLLAHRFRLIALDMRGHGDSEWAGAYTWSVEVQDLVHVLQVIGQPVHLIGHSRGGGQVVDAAQLVPHLVRRIINIDGFGPLPFGPDTPTNPVRMAEFLTRRQRITARPEWRPYPTLDALVARRQAQNPRLSTEWLRYFLYHGATHTADGWRWKVDPQVGFDMAPWQPDWIAAAYAHVRAPMLAIVGGAVDTWGPLPEAILAERLAQLPSVERCTIPNAGHFVHIEQPAATAQAILAYLED